MRSQSYGAWRAKPLRLIVVSMMACTGLVSPAYSQINRLPEAYELYQRGNHIYRQELQRQGRGHQYAPIGTPQWFQRMPPTRPAPQMRPGFQNFAPLYRPFQPLYRPMMPPNPYRRW